MGLLDHYRAAVLAGGPVGVASGYPAEPRRDLVSTAQELLCRCFRLVGEWVGRPLRLAVAERGRAFEDLAVGAVQPDAQMAFGV